MASERVFVGFKGFMDLLISKKFIHYFDDEGTLEDEEYDDAFGIKDTNYSDILIVTDEEKEEWFDLTSLSYYLMIPRPRRALRKFVSENEYKKNQLSPEDILVNSSGVMKLFQMVQDILQE